MLGGGVALQGCSDIGPHLRKDLWVGGNRLLHGSHQRVDVITGGSNPLGEATDDTLRESRTVQDVALQHRH